MNLLEDSVGRWIFLERERKKERNYFNELCQEICENSNSGTATTELGEA